MRERATENEEEDGQVLDQRPGAGVEVDDGALVIVIVGRFEEPGRRARADPAGGVAVRVAVLGRRPRRASTRCRSRRPRPCAPASRRAGHEPVAVEISRDGRWSCRRRAAGAGARRRPARLRRRPSRPCTAPTARTGRCRACSRRSTCPYVGAGVMASAVCMDKVLFKDLMARGRPAAGALRRGPRGRGPGASSRALGLPVFVKPARLGSSVGISKVSDGGRAARPRWRPPSSTTRW